MILLLGKSFWGFFLNGSRIITRFIVLQIRLYCNFRYILFDMIGLSWLLSQKAIHNHSAMLWRTNRHVWYLFWGQLSYLGACFVRRVWVFGVWIGEKHFRFDHSDFAYQVIVIGQSLFNNIGSSLLKICERNIASLICFRLKIIHKISFLQFWGIGIFIMLDFLFNVGSLGILANVLENQFRLFEKSWANFQFGVGVFFRQMPISKPNTIFGTRSSNTLLGSEPILAW